MVLAEAVRTEDKTTLGRAALCSGARHARGRCAEGAVRQVFPWDVIMRQGCWSKCLKAFERQNPKEIIKLSLKLTRTQPLGFFHKKSVPYLFRKGNKKHHRVLSIYDCPNFNSHSCLDILLQYQTPPCSATRSPQRWRLFHVCPRCCFRRGWRSLHGWAGCQVAASPACSKMEVTKRYVNIGSVEWVSGGGVGRGLYYRKQQF